MLKLISIAMAAVPIVLFLRTFLVRRPRQPSPRMARLKTEIDFAVTVFIFIIVCASLYAVVRLIWP